MSSACVCHTDEYCSYCDPKQMKIKVGDTVGYSDFQFGNLDGSVVSELREFVFGIYAVLQLDGEKYVVPYRNLKRIAEGVNK